MDSLSFITGRVVPLLNEGLVMSVWIILPSAVFGFLLGVVVGAARTYAVAPLRIAANAFAATIRGTPLVCQLFILYFGLPTVGIYLDPYEAAVVGFVMCSGAYQSEYIRGGLMATRRGQLLAAQALGFSNFGAMLWIVVPQAIRRALPGCGNEIIYLIKYSSLAYVVTVMELTGMGKQVASETFRFTEVFLVVGAYYLALVTIAGVGLKRLERVLRIPGFGIS